MKQLISLLKKVIGEIHLLQFSKIRSKSGKHNEYTYVNCCFSCRWISIFGNKDQWSKRSAWLWPSALTQLPALPQQRVTSTSVPPTHPWASTSLCSPPCFSAINQPTLSILCSVLSVTVPHRHFNASQQRLILHLKGSLHCLCEISNSIIYWGDFCNVM